MFLRRRIPLRLWSWYLQEKTPRKQWQKLNSCHKTMATTTTITTRTMTTTMMMITRKKKKKTARLKKKKATRLKMKTMRITLP
jgi:hypothetical protein